MNQRRLLRHFTTIATIIAAAWAQPAQAAGYDTPILYTARHMGMGGTAIAYVDDASAMFHNPAGLGHMGAGTLMLDVSLLTGGIVANPAPPLQANYARDFESTGAFAPFFLVGGGARITDWLTVGLAIYPVASAGAGYEYHIVSPGLADGKPVINSSSILDETKIVFFEFAPSIAVNLPGNLHLGLAYRISMVQMQRGQGTIEEPGSVIEFDLSGFNFKGLRAGMQWQPIDELQLGFAYRFKTRTTISGDSSTLFTAPWGHTETTFVLPAKFGLGIRGDIKPVGFALDAEYTFNSHVQEQIYIFESPNNPDATPFELTNYARWSDNLTLRAGLEYCLTLEPLGVDAYIKPRLGYVYDGKVGNRAYPTPFGTPPTATQTLTTGVGYDAGAWEINLAYAYRFGDVNLTPASFPDQGHQAYTTDANCISCGKPGFYEIVLHGMYVDFSYDFD